MAAPKIETWSGQPVYGHLKLDRTVHGHEHRVTVHPDADGKPYAFAQGIAALGVALWFDDGELHLQDCRDADPHDVGMLHYGEPSVYVLPPRRRADYRRSDHVLMDDAEFALDAATVQCRWEQHVRTADGTPWEMPAEEFRLRLVGVGHAFSVGDFLRPADRTAEEAA